MAAYSLAQTLHIEYGRMAHAVACFPRLFHLLPDSDNVANLELFDHLPDERPVAIVDPIRLNPVKLVGRELRSACRLEGELVALRIVEKLNVNNLTDFDVEAVEFGENRWS